MSRPSCAALAGALALVPWSGCASDELSPADTAETTGGEAEPLDADGDGYASSDDCDDVNADVHPGASELCNDVDDDCDGVTDDEPLDGPTWYVDSDGDGHGSDPSSVRSCGAPGGAVGTSGDCDDSNGSIYPGAEEDCDGLDDDCDGETDEEASDAVPCAPDGDSDGYGDTDALQSCCSLDEGWVAPGEAVCDDANQAVHPGADEVCNLRDDDCDGETDEEESTDVLCDLWEEHGLADADLKLVGGAAGDLLGSAIAGGDFDGDGVDDVWVGAAGSDLGGSTSGAAFLLRAPVSGSGLIGDAADATLVGPGAYAEAGGELSPAGDVDTDGLTDLWILATGDTTTGGRGSASLVLGPVTGALSLADADARWVGDDNANFPTAMSSHGDLDGDGVPEAVVGAFKADSGLGNVSGAAWLLHADEPADDRALNEAAVQFLADYMQDGVGRDVRIVGDTTGDGTNDLLISGLGYHTTSYAGLIWVVEEPVSDGTVTTIGDAASETLVGEAPEDYAGDCLAGLGDMNGDGYADYAIGAQGESSVAFYAGAVYVVYGPTAGRTSVAEADARLTGSEALEKAYQVRGDADVDADGWPDVVVGAHYEGERGDLPGQIYLLRGPLEGGTSSLQEVADALFVGEQAGDYAGWSVELVGDTNADGYAEIAIGALAYDNVELSEGDNAGAFYLYLGQPY